MPTVRFTGKVLPETIKISLDVIPEATWKELAPGLDVTFKLRVKNSVLDIECDASRDVGAADLVFLYHKAHDLSRACVDTAAFSLGYGVLIHLDTFVKADGAVTQLLFEDQSLPSLCTAYKWITTAPEDSSRLKEALALIMSEFSIAMALNELIASITVPHQAVINCGRAIEGIRVMMNLPNTKRAKGWLVMRENLNVDEAYLQLVTDTSTGPRHGDRAHITPAITTEITRRSWIVMNRFIEFRLGKSQPLPIDKFPLLIG